MTPAYATVTPRARALSEDTLAKMDYLRRASFVMLSGCTLFYALLLVSGATHTVCG